MTKNENYGRKSPFSLKIEILIEHRNSNKKNQNVDEKYYKNQINSNRHQKLKLTKHLNLVKMFVKNT